jgi:hypothetical protein
MTQQKLLISMLAKPVTSKDQKIYKHRGNFYESVWLFRDMGLVTNNVVEINGTKRKIWKLTVDGTVMARILAKTYVQSKQ